MLPEHRLIFSILREAIGAGPAVILESAGLDWQRFLRLAQVHELIPLAYGSLNRHRDRIPADTFASLETQHYCIVTYTQYLWQEFCRIEAAFEGAAVAIAPIKGMALLKDVYAGLAGRTMIDIDLLAKEPDLPLAERILATLGYRKELFGLSEAYWRNRHTQLAFRRQELEGTSPAVDLHWSLDLKRKGRQLLPFLWERTRQETVEGITMRLLSREDVFFSLLLHQRRFGKPLCLKYAVDTLLLLRRSPGLDWGYILEEGRRAGLNASIFFILGLAGLIIEEPLPRQTIKELGVPFWKRKLALRFIERNVFLSEPATARRLYAQSIFYLYDTLGEPLGSVFFIPKEQFAKFYDLDIYGARTERLYRLRFLYIFWRELRRLAAGIMRAFQDHKG